MIKLFKPTAREFTTNGLGALADISTCTVTEELNGVFELEMEYPITGLHFDEIKNNYIIVAKSNPYSDPQAFRIYSISRPIDGMVTINANHISYDMSGILVKPFNEGDVESALAKYSASEALQQLKVKSVNENPFIFSTNMSDTDKYIFQTNVPSSVKSLLGGSDDGTILSVFGGELEYDNYKVILHGHRGSNTGVSIRYGKNLTDLTYGEDSSEVYTAVAPYYYKKDDGLQYLDGYILTTDISDSSTMKGLNKVKPLDLTSEFDEMPTQAVLKSKAEDYIQNNNLTTPSVSMTVSFVPLARTTEYSDYALLEDVLLGDYVTVEHISLGVKSIAEVVKTTYNAITDQYDSIDLGDPLLDLSDTISSQGASITNIDNTLVNNVNITSGAQAMTASEVMDICQ